ncbi:MAG: DUF4351 domain-containing protein [Cyanobacteriota bacterium]
MAYDNICKALVESDPLPLVRWLIGDPVAPIQILKTELSLEPIRADFVSFLQVGSQLLHLEFQTAPDPDMPLRMLDYCVRLTRQYRCQVLQIVLFLRETTSTLVQIDRFESVTTLHRYRVVRLWEEPAEAMLKEPRLWPLAILGRAANPEAILRQVAGEIQKLSSGQERANLATYTYLLGGLRFNKEVLRQLLREDVMRESVTYQALVEESKQLGLAEGLSQGIQQGESELVIRQLRRKLGEIPLELQIQIRSLSVEQLEALAEALLDFGSLEALIDWLEDI